MSLLIRSINTPVRFRAPPIMTSLILYPHQSLFKCTKRVTLEQIKSSEFRDLVSSMFKIMYGRRGVGLSANQLGSDARVFVMNQHGRKHHNTKAMVFINPELIYDGEKIIDIEGCLSIPNIWVSVSRYSRVKIRHLTETGWETETVLDGFDARIAAHEFDHLNGLTMLDVREVSLDSESFNEELIQHVKNIDDLRKQRQKKVTKIKKKKKKRNKKKKRKR